MAAVDALLERFMLVPVQARHPPHHSGAEQFGKFRNLRISAALGKQPAGRFPLRQELDVRLLQESSAVPEQPLALRQEVLVAQVIRRVVIAEENVEQLAVKPGQAQRLVRGHYDQPRSLVVSGIRAPLAD